MQENDEMKKRHEMWELQQMQALPLKMKIKLTQSRIRQWVNEFGEDGVYISFSGGKDSTVLLDIARKMYPEIKAVYVDTGLEYPEIKHFVKGFDNVEIIRPEMVFKDVIIKYGYPMISKEVSECVQGARKYLTRILNEKDNFDRQTDRQIPYSANFADLIGVDRRQEKENEDYKAIKMGIIPSLPNDAPVRAKMFFGEYMHKEKGVETNEISLRYDKTRYSFMLDAPFEVSHMCCGVMKKKPLKWYANETKRNPMTAQMAAESRLRTQKWLQNGCNAFDAKNPISNPMSFWTEQDVLLYIKEENLIVANVYGKIIEDNFGTGEVQGQLTVSDIQGWEEMSSFDAKRLPLKTTGCTRTGCMFCGFGCHLEKSPNRFERMAETHSKLLDYVMRGGAFDKDDGLWKPDKRGLGFWFILMWINVHGNFNIAIPNYEQYEKEYGTELTREYLKKE